MPGVEHGVLARRRRAVLRPSTPLLPVQVSRRNQSEVISLPRVPVLGADAGRRSSGGGRVGGGVVSDGEPQRQPVSERGATPGSATPASDRTAVEAQVCTSMRAWEPVALQLLLGGFGSDMAK